VPGMKSLYSHRLRAIAAGCLALGILSTAVGIVLAQSTVLVTSLGLVFAGVLAFVANFARVARWALLELSYRPTAEEWRRFEEMFPAAKR